MQTIEATIARAVALHTQIKAMTAELDSCKHEIREHALTFGLSADSRPVVMTCATGEARVSYVRESLKPAKGADLDAVSRSIPKRIADGLFERRTVLTEGAMTFYRMLESGDVARLGGALVVSPNTPKVELS